MKNLCFTFLEGHPGHSCEDRTQKYLKLWILESGPIYGHYAKVSQALLENSISHAKSCFKLPWMNPSVGRLNNKFHNNHGDEKEQKQAVHLLAYLVLPALVLFYL